MSKKSKHKPKGQKNPPQNIPVAKESSQVKEEQEVKIQDVLPPAPPVKVEVVQPVEEKVTTDDVKAGETTGSGGGGVQEGQVPVKPKRHRGNRNKKKNADGGGSVEGFEIVDAKDVENLEKKYEVAIPVEDDKSKEVLSVDAVKEGEVNKNKGESGKKNKKGGGGNKGDEKPKADEKPAVPQSDQGNKKKGGKGGEDKPGVKVDENVKKGDKKSETNKNVKEDKKQEVKNIESENKNKDPQVKGEGKAVKEEISGATNVGESEIVFVEAKGKKSKNKKNKETPQEAEVHLPAETDKRVQYIDVIEINEEKKENTPMKEIVGELKSEDVVCSMEAKGNKKSKGEKKECLKEKSAEITGVADLSISEMKTEVIPSQGESKSSKKNKNKGKNEEIKTNIVSAEAGSKDSVKEEIQSEKPVETPKRRDKKQKGESKSKKDDDDILPSLASSIEETLQKLIACESDKVLEEQIKAEEEKQKQDIPKPQSESHEIAETKEKIEDKKGIEVTSENPPITTILPFIPPLDLLHLGEEKQKVVEETDIKCDKKKQIAKKIEDSLRQKAGTPEPIPLPFIASEESQEIKAEKEVIDGNKKDKKEKQKKEKKNEKQGKAESIESKGDFHSIEVRDVPLAPPENVKDYFYPIKIETNIETCPIRTEVISEICSMKAPTDQIAETLELKKPEITGMFRKLTPERFEKKNKSGRSTPTKDAAKKHEPEIVKSSVPDDIIAALLSDIPPLHVADTHKSGPSTPEPVCPIHLVKSETIKENLPKCEVKEKDKEKGYGIPEAEVIKEATDKSKAEVFETQKTIEAEAFCPLTMPASEIKPTVNPPDDAKIGKISTKEDIKLIDILTAVESTEQKTGENIEPHEKSEGKKHKSKKHDKKKDSHEVKLEDVYKVDISKCDTKIPEENIIIAQCEVIPEMKSVTLDKPAVVDESAPKSSEVIVSPESAKVTDSPKPAKRAKDKKSKQGKHPEAPSTQTSSVQASGTSSIQGETFSSSSQSQGSQDTREKEKKEESRKEKDQQKDTAGKSHSQECPKPATDTAPNPSISSEDPMSALYEAIEDFQIRSDSDEPDGRIVTGDIFEFVTLPETPETSPAPEQSTSKEKKEDVKKDKKSLKDHSKNLLGQSNIPAKSNKYDYKKEKNKDPEMCNTESATIKMKDVDPKNLPESKETAKSKDISFPDDKKADFKKVSKKAHPLTEITEIDTQQFIDEEEEEFVYKYSFRTVFIANACHICKIQLNNERVVCRFCHLVGYCAEKHRDDDWTQHQSLCYAICTLSHVKGVDHIYSMAKSLSGHEFRLLRMQAIVACEKLLKRKLCPWEQEVLLYPRICVEVNCREWRSDMLKDCEGCGQVSHCTSTPSHLPQSHQEWCQPYRLYHKLVTHQLSQGRIEPALPTKLMPPGYILPDTLAVLLGDLYGGKLNMDECHYATLTQLSTAPLTALYAYQKALQKMDVDPSVKKDKLSVHIVGAELQFEADTLNKWEAFFLHLLGDLKELKVVFVGPELNSSKLPINLLTRIKMCPSCRQLGRLVKFEFHDEILYHDFVETDKFTKPDLICAFNPGFHRATGHAGLDTWPATIASLLRLQVPICTTSYTAHEAPRDLARILEVAGAPAPTDVPAATDPNTKAPVESCEPKPCGAPTAKVVVPPTKNPHSSLRPDRNFISDDEAPLIFKNYHFMVTAG